MDTIAATLWNSLLQQKGSLWDVLSSELQQELKGLPVIPLEKLAEPHSPDESLDEIHYSWFSPFLRTLPEKEIKLFLAALSSEQAKGLKQALLLSSNLLPSVSALGRRYLRQTLFEAIAPEDLLPLSLLPECPLNILVTLAPDEILSLIDLLSMHDLSVEIKHIIDTVKLKEIHSLLTKPQLTFLKTLLHKKEPITFKRIGLARWEKDHEVLHALLVQRGINRLAKALYTSSRSLLWHVAHRLDIEKGQTLLKLSSALSNEKAYEILTEQVLELISSLKDGL